MRFSRGKIWFVDIGPCKRFDIFQLWSTQINTKSTLARWHFLHLRWWPAGDRTARVAKASLYKEIFIRFKHCTGHLLLGEQITVLNLDICIFLETHLSTIPPFPVAINLENDKLTNHYFPRVQITKENCCLCITNLWEPMTVLWREAERSRRWLGETEIEGGEVT